MIFSLHTRGFEYYEEQLAISRKAIMNRVHGENNKGKNQYDRKKIGYSGTTFLLLIFYSSGAQYPSCHQFNTKVAVQSIWGWYLDGQNSEIQ